MFTSPSLQSYRERFIYNDDEISEESLIELLEYIEKILGSDECTLFEAITCAFIKYAENFKDNVNLIYLIDQLKYIPLISYP